MQLKKIFYLGLVSGIMAAIAAIIYTRVYHFANEADFSKIVNIRGLLAINIGAGLLIAIVYWVFTHYFKATTSIFFNLLITIVSFASLIVPFSISLPLDITNPELFPGLAVPLHFFPVLAWFTLKPLFIRET